MIRLQRVGRRNHPSFRVIITESQRGPKSGDFIENVGSYNPHINEVVLDGERIKHWIANGAQVSDTVHNLLISQKIIEGKKINVLPRKSPIVKEEEEKSEEAPKKEEATTEAETATDDTPKEEEAPVEEAVFEEASKEE